MDADSIMTRFREVFQTTAEPLIIRSPGRINLIGEHTDYNDGFVLPAAIDKAAYVAAYPRSDQAVGLFAEEFGEYYETTLDAVAKTDMHWPDYVLGVVGQLQATGAAISGFNLFITSDIPIGAGLASSAALECATVYALNELFSLHLSKAEMALVTQLAEHVFAGVNCGVMDMFTSLFGQKDKVIHLDCRSLLYEYVPLKLDGYKMLLLNTNVKHQLSSSEYNIRRRQCEQGVEWVQQHVHSVQALRDVSIDMLDAWVLPKDATIYKRCRYVVGENDRLQQACANLKAGNLHGLGQKMFASHQGLSDDYEVSCAELDFLVDYVKSNKAVLGARMMGGGFGGCTINIVKEAEIASLLSGIVPAYRAATGLPLTYYIVAVEAGTSILTKTALTYV